MSYETVTASVLKDLANEMTDEYEEIIRRIEEILRALIDENIGLTINKVWGGVTKIGVFGAYKPDENKVILDEICQYIVNKGYIVISGYGFYHPSQPTVYQSLDKILTPTIQKIFKNPRNTDLLYSDFIPSIIDKAVCRVFPLRTQMYEIKGCRKYNKPVLGFVDHKDVQLVADECNWVDVDSRDINIIKKCSCNDVSSCPVDHGRKVCCIFYEPCPIPQVIKNMFLDRSKIWKFYALNNYKLVYPLIDTFL